MSKLCLERVIYPFVLYTTRTLSPLIMGLTVATTHDDPAVSSINAELPPTEMTTRPEEKAPTTSLEDNGDEEMENPARPKGARFVILFLSILAGDFFVGYVCDKMFPRCCRAQHPFV